MADDLFTRDRHEGHYNRTSGSQTLDQRRLVVSFESGADHQRD
jgi:hypothetical protein